MPTKLEDLPAARTRAEQRLVWPMFLTVLHHLRRNPRHDFLRLDGPRRLLLQLVHRVLFMKMRVLTIVWALLVFSRLLSHP